MLFVIIAWSYRPTVRVFLVGDSTMADKPVVDNPERGWGQLLPLFFDSDVRVENYAKNGRSTKSFLDEGPWRRVDENLRLGDYVFIQFGHDDERTKDTSRYAAPHLAYKQNLVRFVRDAKAKGAIPVLLTPVQRRKFDNAGRLVETHGDYPDVVREVAREEDVSLIDLTKESGELFDHAGPEETKKLFMWIRPGTFPLIPNGKEDNTHFTEYGAFTIAGLVAKSLRESTLPLKSYLREVSSESLIGLNKIVALDYYYNCEFKQVGSTMVQYHYTWEDTANSGFSDLGRAIYRTGVYITRSRTAPTGDFLKTCSIYVLVDPDTPSETALPHSIEDSTAEAIARWVHEGGVLVLMGNDKGNCEFEHLNMLAGHFGIHFNEDSYHRVVGSEYGMGKFSYLPDHPIFSGVRQIYLKEICSLTLTKPAQTVLQEDGHVFMASSHFGKGLVFAVGDPWLYNEYVDGKKLPRGSRI